MKYPKNYTRKFQSNNVPSTKNLTRKEMRKALRKQKKVNNAIHYAKSKNTDKVCISSDDLKFIKTVQDRVSRDENDAGIFDDLYSSLENKVLSNDKKENIKRVKKRKKKAKRSKPTNNNQNEENEEGEASSFKLSNGSNLRLAKLQEYVNKESQNINNNQHKESDSKSLQNYNKIKDKTRVKELMLGKKRDEKEINKMAKKLRLSTRQKKKLDPVFVEDFGCLLEDIEEGTFDAAQKYKYDDLNYDSDEKFESDMMFSLGKNASSKIKLNDSKGKNESDSDLSYSYNNCKKNTENEKLVETDEDDIEANLDNEACESSNESNFLDDEAEVDDEYEESDDEPAENEAEIVFESGSMLKSDCKPVKSNPPTINSLFQLYSSDSEDEEESDLDGFIVDDDYIEYCDSDDNTKEKSKKRKRKSRIIGRDRSDVGLTDSPEIIDEACVADMNGKFKKRRRILSESDNEVEIFCSKSPKKIEEDTDSMESDKENGFIKTHDSNSLTGLTCIESNVKSILKHSELSNSSTKKKRKNKKNKKIRVSFSLPEDDNDANISNNQKDEHQIANHKSEDNQNSNDKCINEEYHEDIYGRLRDKTGKLVCPKESDTLNNSKYIPPAMRKLMTLNNDAKKKEQLLELQKKLKGQLNRLAESNIAGILSQIEGYYQINSRNDMNDSLTKLLFESLVTPVLTPERLIQDNALLVSVLSANVGSEVGAHILTEFVVKWVELLENFNPTEKANEIDSKELDNLLSFISHLYNFKVVEASLIYDVLNKILRRDLNAKEVDLILLVLRSVGFSLRKEDPLALKSFIIQINIKAKERSEKSDQTYTRVKFMLEILTAIKNNNVSKVPNYDQSLSKHLKTLMKGLIRKGCRTSGLKISLEDLLKSKSVGRWWVVGSAWAGGLKELNVEQGDSVKEGKATILPSANTYRAEFINKASQLKMTRPPRINILYAITDGAENCQDAFEKLIQLGLPNNQEQEIFNVMVFCCTRYKEYNPFYNILALKLIKFKKGFARLLQFSIWNAFKELSNMKPHRAANLAKFVSHLIADGGLNLSLFKELNFAGADTETISFLRQALLGIFLHPTGTYAVTSSFNHLCSLPAYSSLRQYIRLFIVMYINPKKLGDEETKQILKLRVDMALKILAEGGVKL